MALTQARVKELFEYREDGNLYWKIKPSRSTNIGDIAGWNNGGGYKKVRVNKKPEFVHRLIFLYHHGWLPKFVDHEDVDPCNNRISNLRSATRADNARNKSKQQNNTTGYTGVFFRKDSNKFRAIIGMHGKLVHLGTYKTAKEAAFAYNEAAIRLHGEFASLNKLTETA